MTLNNLVKMIIVSLVLISGLEAAKVEIQNGIAKNLIGKFMPLEKIIFVARPMNISNLFEQIDQLEQEGLFMQEKCEQIKKISDSIDKDTTYEAKVTAMEDPIFDLFIHAKKNKVQTMRMCKTLRQKGPEIVTGAEAARLFFILRYHNITSVWADVTFDPTAHLYRFTNNKMPIHEGLFDLVFDRDKTNWMKTKDVHVVRHAVFYYTARGLEFRNVFSKDAKEYLAVIDEPEWEASNTANLEEGHIRFDSITKPVLCQQVDTDLITLPRNDPSFTDSIDYDLLYRQCKDASSRIIRSANERNDEIVEHLKLANIKIRRATRSKWVRRKKRGISFILGSAMLSLPKFFMELQNFYKLEQLEYQTGKLEVTTTKLVTELKEQSVRIDDLKLSQIATNQQLNNLNKEVMTLHRAVFANSMEIAKVKIDLQFQQVSNEAIRTIDLSIAELREIVAAVTKGNTSPFSLSYEDMVEVRTQVKLSLDADLLYDFGKIKSLLMVDPEDHTKLLLVMRMLAMKNRPLEMVELISIPQYHQGYTYSIDIPERYFAITDDHKEFVKVKETNVLKCQESPCPFDSTKRSTIYSKDCSIPLFYRDNKDIECKKILKYGWEDYFKPIHPHGCLYSVKEPVRISIICPGLEDSKSKRTVTINGAGLLRLPAGCHGLTSTSHYEIPGPPVTEFVKITSYDEIRQMPEEQFKQSAAFSTDSSLYPELEDLLNKTHSDKIRYEVISTDLSLIREESSTTQIILIIMGVVIGCLIIAGGGLTYKMKRDRVNAAAYEELMRVVETAELPQVEDEQSTLTYADRPSPRYATIAERSNKRPHLQL